MCECVHLFISGRVQGVCFRATACDKAKAFGVAGFVRNCSDGRVEVEAEGEVSQLQKLVEWCRKGPPGALIRDVETIWKPADNQYQDFVVRY